ncbi:MAG TPA: ABC transporter substrate-binding protein, partial [Bacillota bacterium]|nr:ABC transporter substrate-binding protein [Bacillota bacterium]
MFKSKRTLIIVALAIMLLLNSLTSLQAAVKFPLKLKDQFGRTLIIPKAPTRIVSAAPSNTETLFALGLNAKIVGVTNWCNYPSEAQKIEKIGDIYPLNVEKIISLNPDLVVANNLNQLDKEGNVAKLMEFGVPVLILKTLSFKDILDSIALIGQATGADKQAETLVKQLYGTMNRVQKQGAIIKKRGLKVYILLGWDSIWTAGPGSFLDEAVTLGGGINIASDLDQPWGQLSTETVLQRNPDVIITDIDPEKIYNDKIW